MASTARTPNPQAAEWLKKALLRHIQRDTGLILLLEDTQCADPSTCPCIEDLLSKALNSVYSFRPDDLDDHIEGRWSFKQLVHEWKRASYERKNDGGSFPDIRPKTELLTSTGCFIECVLRCTCYKCNAGTAVQIQCKPFDFGSGGDNILIHEFKYEGKTWAVILGDLGEFPPVYRLWGAYEEDPTVTSYNEFVTLEEVTFNDPPSQPSASRRKTKRTATCSAEALGREAKEETSEDIIRTSHGKVNKRSAEFDAGQQPKKRARFHRGIYKGLFGDWDASYLPNTGRANRVRLSDSGTQKRATNSLAQGPSGVGLYGDDDDDGDDEGTIPSSIPQATKAAPKSTPTTANLTPSQPSPPIQESPISQQQQQRPQQQIQHHKPQKPSEIDLNASYGVVCNHMATQVPPGRERPILFLDEELQVWMKLLFKQAQQGNEKAYRQICGMIDDVLVKNEVEKLPVL